MTCAGACITLIHPSLLIFHLLPHVLPISLFLFQQQMIHVCPCICTLAVDDGSDRRKSSMCFCTSLGCKYLFSSEGEMCVLSMPGRSDREFPMLAQGVVWSVMYELANALSSTY